MAFPMTPVPIHPILVVLGLMVLTRSNDLKNKETETTESKSTQHWILNR